MVRGMVAHHALYVTGTVGAVLALVTVDRSPSDAANQASLAVLLLAAGSLGLIRPGAAGFAGGVIGSSLAVAHAIYEASHAQLPYPMSPSGWTGVLALLLLLVPALAAAYAGAAAGRMLRRARDTPDPA